MRGDSRISGCTGRRSHSAEATPTRSHRPAANPQVPMRMRRTLRENRGCRDLPRCLHVRPQERLAHGLPERLHRPSDNWLAQDHRDQQGVGGRRAHHDGHGPVHRGERQRSLRGCARQGGSGVQGAPVYVGNLRRSQRRLGLGSSDHLNLRFSKGAARLPQAGGLHLFRLGYNPASHETIGAR